METESKGQLSEVLDGPIGWPDREGGFGRYRFELWPNWECLGRSFVAINVFTLTAMRLSPLRFSSLYYLSELHFLSPTFLSHSFCLHALWFLCYFSYSGLKLVLSFDLATGFKVEDQSLSSLFSLFKHRDCFICSSWIEKSAALDNLFSGLRYWKQ